MATIKTELIGGMTVNFECDSDGVFRAHLDELGTVSAKTFDEVRELATKAIGKVKNTKKIAATVVHIGPRSQHGYGEDFGRGVDAYDMTLRGVSERLRNVLATHEGKKVAIGISTFGDNILRRLTDAEKDEYRRLIAAQLDIEQSIEKFIATRRLDWRKELGVGR